MFCSSVTPRTIDRRINAFLLYDPGRKLLLIRGRQPSHIRQFRSRPQVHVRVSVAVKAPAHAERLYLRDNFHFGDISMTAGATDAGMKVSTVVKIAVLTDLVDPNPLQRVLFVPAFANRQQSLTLRQNQLMAVHTGLSGGYVRVGGKFNRIVAVPAIDAQIAGVERVAVSDRLSGPVSDIGVPW
jgi:hypothetical protein